MHFHVTDVASNALERPLERVEADRTPGAGDIGDEIDSHGSPLSLPDGVRAAPSSRAPITTAERPGKRLRQKSPGWGSQGGDDIVPFVAEEHEFRNREESTSAEDGASPLIPKNIA
jgi:hypothetical protein